MRTLVLDFHSYAVSDALWKAFPKSSGFHIQAVEAPEHTVESCRFFAAFAAVLEVVGNIPAYSLEARLRLCEELREVCPDCRLVLLADERAERSIAESCREALCRREIALYIDGSASVNQLVSMLELL